MESARACSTARIRSAALCVSLSSAKPVAGVGSRRSPSALNVRAPICFSHVPALQLPRSRSRLASGWITRGSTGGRSASGKLGLLASISASAGSVTGAKRSPQILSRRCRTTPPVATSTAAAATGNGHCSVGAVSAKGERGRRSNGYDGWALSGPSSTYARTLFGAVSPDDVVPCRTNQCPVDRHRPPDSA